MEMNCYIYNIFGEGIVNLSANTAGCVINFKLQLLNLLCKVLCFANEMKKYSRNLLFIFEISFN